MNKKEIFSRHELFLGEAKLNILRRSSILVAGIGGLGSVVSEQLVRLGIGKLILIDTEKVDLPDLNRQQLYTSEDIGARKVKAAIKRLSRIHSFTELIGMDLDVQNKQEVADLISQHKVTGIADCLDNYRSRFALEEHVKQGLFLVHGGVEQDFGQVVTILEQGRLTKLYSREEVNDQVIPVIPTIVGVVGAIMTQEILNNLWGGPELVDEMLLVELDGYRFSRIKIN